MHTCPVTSAGEAHWQHQICSGHRMLRTAEDGVFSWKGQKLYCCVQTREDTSKTRLSPTLAQMPGTALNTSNLQVVENRPEDKGNAVEQDYGSE